MCVFDIEYNYKHVMNVNMNLSSNMNVNSVYT